MILTGVLTTRETNKNLDSQTVENHSFFTKIILQIENVPFCVHTYEVLFYTGTEDKFSECEVTYWDYIK